MAWFWSWPCRTCWIWFLFILAKPGKPILSFGYFCLFWPIFDCLGLFGSIWAYLGLLNTYSEIMAWYGSWPCWTCWKWFLFIMAKPGKPISILAHFGLFLPLLPILVRHFKCLWSFKITRTKDKKNKKTKRPKAREIPYACQRYTYRVLQTIQMKLLLLWVWAEWAVLGRAKTA